MSSITLYGVGTPEERGLKYDEYIRQNKSCAEYSSEMCQNCIKQYREYYVKNRYIQDLEEEEYETRLANNSLPPEIIFPVECQGDLRKGLGDVANCKTDDDYAIAGLVNPDIWFKEELGLDLRWYQSDSASCTARAKVDRWGRRTGKTHHKVGSLLQSCMLGKGIDDNGQLIPEKILVVAPFQVQIDEIFNKINELLGPSKTLKHAITRRTKSPYQVVEFDNGSKITGLCVGTSEGSTATKTRGQDATKILADEADFMLDHDVESFMAILASRSDTAMYVTSTPTGKHGKFFEFCMNKSLGFKETHITCFQSPEWNPNTERILRRQYSKANWDREILAIFGEVADGVFNTSMLMKSLSEYEYGPHLLAENAIITMGVDWNGPEIGIPIVVIAFLPDYNTYVVVDKFVSKQKEFTQLNAIKDIVEMYEKWQAHFIYFDAGYGNTNIEVLKKYAMDNKQTNLLKRIKPIEMNGKTMIRDPYTKQEVAKQNKALMIDMAVQRVENGMCHFPYAENEKNELVDQLRNYKIERHTPTGIPVYSQGHDHQLIAWALAMYALTMEFSDIAKITGLEKAIGYLPAGVSKQDIGVMPKVADSLTQAVVYSSNNTNNKPTMPRLSSLYGSSFERKAGKITRTRLNGRRSF